MGGRCRGNTRGPSGSLCMAVSEVSAISENSIAEGQVPLPCAMTIVAFDHLTLRCADLPTSWRFYADVLGLRVAERTGISIPAAIVYLGDQQLLHLFQATPDLQTIFERLAPPDAEAAAWGT